jgi:predicted RNA polymerase sigma factor
MAASPSLAASAASRGLGPYGLQAAIAACHASASDTGQRDAELDREVEIVRAIEVRSACPQRAGACGVTV